MTVYFSDHFTPDGVDRTSESEIFVKNTGAVDGAFIRYKRALLDTTPSTLSPDPVPSGAQLRMLELKSSIRPIAMYISNPGGFPVGMLFDIGLRLPGVQNDGLIIDRDLFANDLAADAAQDRLEVIGSAGSELSMIHRGLPLWEMVNIAQPGEHPVDPQTKMHLTIKAGAAGGAGDNVAMELYYTRNG